MSESESFIREVSEEVRRERFSRLLRRYGWIGALVLLAIIGAAGLNEWRKARQEAAAQAAGDTLREVFLIESPTERARRLEAVAASLEDGRSIARFAQAGSLLEAEDVSRAATVLAAVSEDSDLAPIYRDLALLQRVAALGSEMDRTERMASLETLVRLDGPFRLLALEQRALARLEAGERDEARADLEALLGDPGLPEGLASRARQLLVAAGGEVPGTLPAAAVLDRAVVPGEAGDEDAPRAAADG